MRLSVATVGPFALPLLVAAGALWLGLGQEETGAPEYAVIDAREPGTLRIGIAANPPNLDPIEATDTTSSGVLSRVISKLVSFDPDLNIEPDLARELPEISEDGLVYTFRLRENVKFHHGRTVTAADVKYSLQRLAEPWSKRFNWIAPIKGAAEARQAMIDKGMQRGDPQVDIEGLEVVDDLTIRMTLAERQPLILMFLTMNNCAIVPREVVEKEGQQFARQPIGTGPFRVVELRDNDRVILERFDDYFKGPAKLERVVFRIITEEETRFRSYLNGELDIIQPPDGNIRRIQASNIGSELVINPLLDTRYHCFNMERTLTGPDGAIVPFGGNPESKEGGVALDEDQARRARLLRKAFNYAIDREFLCDVILEGRAIPAKGVLPPTMREFDPDLEGYVYDPEKARALLAEAGFPGGEGLPVISYEYNFQPPNPTIAQAIQAMLLEVGIRTELKQLDWGAYIPFLDAGGGNFSRMAWIGDYPDAENFLLVLFHSMNKGQQGNNARFVDARNDAQLEKANATIDPVERVRLWREAERYIVDEAPWAFLYHSAAAIMIKPYVKGWRLCGMDSGPELAEAEMHQFWIEEGGR